MRIIFIGSVEFSYRALEKLVALEADVVGVFTSDNRNLNSDFRDLKDLCMKHDIPVRSGENINDPKMIEWIKLQCPDILFCFGWSRLLKKEVLELAPRGVVGFHPSALPKNRGRHPDPRAAVKECCGFAAKEVNTALTGCYLRTL